MSEIYGGADDPRVLRAFGNPAASGDNTIIAAVPGRKIKVLAGGIVNNVATANTVFWKSAAATISPNVVLPASVFGAVVYPYNEAGWMQNLNVNEALILNLSAATAVGVWLVYILV